MGRIFAGTSGWAYPKWRRGFYPEKLSSKDFLSSYSSRLNSVEVNYTFLHNVSAPLLSEWISATPKGFVFAVKAPQRITHIRRLRDSRALTRDFVKSLAPLREARKLGPILFQLPPNMICDVARLGKFLSELPKRHSFAVEFRHPSWFTEEVYAELRKRGVALCLAESEKIQTPLVQTAAFHYLRLRKSNYSARKVAQRAEKLAQTRDVFLYFKHEDTPEGPLNAEAVLKLTTARKP